MGSLSIKERVIYLLIQLAFCDFHMKKSYHHKHLEKKWSGFVFLVKAKVTYLNLEVLLNEQYE